MSRTTISVDEHLLKQAKKAGLNISQEARKGIERKLDEPTYHLFNTNEKHLPNGQTGAGIYSRGIVATFADSKRPEDVDRFGGYIAEVKTNDRIVSWQNKIGIRAVGVALEDGDAEPVPKEQRLFHSPTSSIHEFHVPVKWKAVLTPSQAPYTDEVKRICNSKIWANVTYRKLNDNHFPEALWDVVVGRANQ